MDVRHFCPLLLPPAMALRYRPHRPLRRHGVHGHPRRLVFGFLFFLLNGAGLAPAHAEQSYSQSLSFQTSNQSQWASGPQYVASWSDTFSKSWNNSGGGGSFTDLGIPQECTPAVVVAGVTIIPAICTPAVDLGNFGAEGNGSTSGEIGLRPTATVNGGAVTVSYPVQVTIQYPDNGTLYPGDPFTLFTSFMPNSGGSLTSSSPHARVTMDALLNATFSASADVKAFGSDVFNASLDIPPIGSDQWITILDTDSPYFQGVARGAQFLANYKLGAKTNGILSGGFKNLSINTSGGPVANSNSLASQGEDTFFTAKIDYSNAALTAFDLPGFNKVINVPIGSAGSLSAALQILDAYEQIDFKVGQAFKFNPTPHFSLQLSNGQALNLDAGQSTQLTFPTVTAGATSNDLTVTPTCALNNQLSNETDLIVSPSYNFNPFHVGFSGSLNTQSPLPSFNIGFDFDPAGTFSWFPGDISIPLFNQSFPLQGFSSTQTAPFVLKGYTYPQPTLTSVSPPAFKPGATTQLTAMGTNFVPSHTNAVNTLPSTTAQWNGANQTSQYDTASQLTFNLSQTQANTEGIYNVDVTNPAPAGGTSNTQKVIIDGTPPVSSDSLSGPQNTGNHGWYKGNVTVNLSTNDTLSGVKEVDYSVDGGTLQPNITGSSLGPGTYATPSFTVPGEARHHVNYHGTDNVGNMETQQTQEIDIDGTAPVVTYTGNAGSYTVDQQVSITCSSADPNLADGEPGSGVFSNTCQNVTGPAYIFNLGNNTYSASATDAAGNVGTASTSFTVQATYDSVCALVQRFVTQDGIANSLCVKLQNASDAAARGDLNAKAGLLGAFSDEVQAQSGKAMTTDQAAVLLKAVGGL